MFAALLILIIGIIIIFINYLLFNKKSSCPAKRVVYNYIPRTQTELQQIQVPEQDVIDLSQQLFDKASPWVDRMNNRRGGLNESNINLYYISQY